MKQRARLILAAGALAVIGCQDTTQPDAGEPEFARAAGLANRYVVVFTGDVANAPGLARQLVGTHGGSLHHTYQHALKGFAATLGAQAVEALRRDPRVAFVEPDLEVRAIQTLPTGIDRIDADQNAAANIDGVDERVDVDIAILDTGVDLDHPDLNVISFQNCIDANNDDGNGHGSHVAGTAAALDNGIDVVGVSPGARIWAVKVLGDNGGGTISSVICGLDFVTANAALIEVGNMSLGAQGTSVALRTAIANSVSAGVFYAVAAGNNGMDVYGPDETFDTGDDFIPAAYPEVATVSAMADFDGQAGGNAGRKILIGCGRVFDDAIADCFSNFSTNVAANNPVNSPGAAIDVAGPGVSIFSTSKNGGTATLTGTSMSSPHVAGAAALFIAINGRATNAAGVAAIRQALIDAGQPQSQWRPDGKTRDDDDNLEPLVFVGAFGPPPPPGNTAPTADDKPLVSTNEDSPVTVTLTASDPEECELNFSIVDGPANGVLSVVTNQPCTAGTPNADAATVTYTPNADFNGSNSFTYTANDGTGTSTIATVSITINAVNDAPVANDDAASTTKDTPVTIDVLANDSDVDGDALSVTVATIDPVNGSSVLVNPDNMITYTPGVGFTGIEVFTYDISDGLLTDGATVTVTVNEPVVGDPAPTVSLCDPDSGRRDTRSLVMVFGSNFQNGATVDFGQQIQVRDVAVINATELEVEIRINKRAPIGPRDVTVTNPDLQSGTGLGCFTVTQ